MYKNLWLCLYVGWVYVTKCWSESQQVRQRWRQVGAERWTTLEHDRFVK